MSARALLLLLPLLLLAGPAPAQRGEATIPLEVFIQQVSHLWTQGDVGGLVELAPADGRIVLGTGSGTEAVSGRHAAAALRTLFADRDAVTVRPVRVTLAGGSPPRGFGELSWAYRSRGAPAAQTRSVYIGAIWEEGSWRIRELRVIE